ncbi:class II aldolase/adducin family protein [Sinisalibacter aestuarii]|uniref:Class II aldolase n=1 Tax=Sinisalibacter aestuarii TaxID=2949426 RepID=A0ABQ5LZ89_9RHOB|nr:class II aldolase/adducin family protein [Sinisalibacter aestuarii]GKY90118.1 class II aldolase [Sinisalibacter aestuarii]
MDYPELREKLVQAGKVLCANGQDDLTRGHVSARLPDNPGLFLMKPHSVGLDELTPDCLLTIDLDGNVVAGKGRRHSEAFIHTEIYRARPDVHAMLHTHPTYCVALTASGEPLRPVSQPAALFHQRLGLYEDTINLIRTPEMGRGVAVALAANRAVLLKHHGIVCTGASVEEAVIGAIMLENAAMIQLVADASGSRADPFPDGDIEKLRDALGKQEQFTINFDYLVRRLR